MDYGSHTPYILATYGATIVVIGLMIAFRIHKFHAATRDETKRREGDN